MLALSRTRYVRTFVPEGRGELFLGDPAAVLRAPPHAPGLSPDPLLRHVPCQPGPQENPVHRHEVVRAAYARAQQRTTTDDGNKPEDCFRRKYITIYLLRVCNLFHFRILAFDVRTNLSRYVYAYVICFLAVRRQYRPTTRDNGNQVNCFRLKIDTCGMSYCVCSIARFSCFMPSGV